MNVFIRQQAGEFQWFKTTEVALHPEKMSGSLDELAQFYHANPDVKNWVLVAPAIDVSARTIEYSDKEKKHIVQAIPFLLEDSLLTEADDLHVVMDAAEKPNAMDVVAIDQLLLQQWVQRFSDAGIRLSHCIAESLFLPASDAQWQIFYRGKEFIIRAESGESVAMDAEHFALSLDLLSDGYASLPNSVELITENDADFQQAMALMPSAVSPLVKNIQLGYADMLQQQFTSVAKVWNLLTGQFAVAQQWVAMIKPWRWVALSLLAVFCINMVLTYSELQQMKQHNAMLKQQMDSVFRQVVPRGNIVDHRKQLERHLKKATAGGGGQAFIQRMDKIGSVLAEHKIQSVNALNYDMEKSEIRLDFLVNDYDALQTIMTGFKNAGLVPEIQNSNAQGAQLRTRLRITG